MITTFQFIVSCFLLALCLDSIARLSIMMFSRNGVKKKTLVSLDKKTNSLTKVFLYLVPSKKYTKEEADVLEEAATRFWSMSFGLITISGLIYSLFVPNIYLIFPTILGTILCFWWTRRVWENFE